MAFVKRLDNLLNSSCNRQIGQDFLFHACDGAADRAVFFNIEVLPDLLQVVSLEGAGEVDGDVAGIVGDSACG